MFTTALNKHFFRLAYKTSCILAMSLIVLPSFDASNSFTPMMCYNCSSSSVSSRSTAQSPHSLSDTSRDDFSTRRGQYVGSVSSAQLDDQVLLNEDNSKSTQFDPGSSTLLGISGGYSVSSGTNIQDKLKSESYDKNILNKHKKFSSKDKLGNPTNSIGGVRGPFGGFGGSPFGGLGGRPFGTGGGLFGGGGPFGGGGGPIGGAGGGPFQGGPLQGGPFQGGAGQPGIGSFEGTGSGLPGSSFNNAQIGAFGGASANLIGGSPNGNPAFGTPGNVPGFGQPNNAFTGGAFSGVPQNGGFGAPNSFPGSVGNDVSGGAFGAAPASTPFGSSNNFVGAASENIPGSSMFGLSGNIPSSSGFGGGGFGGSPQNGAVGFSNGGEFGVGAAGVSPQTGAFGTSGTVPNNGISGVPAAAGTPNNVQQILGQQFTGQAESSFGGSIQSAQTELKPEVLQSGSSLDEGGGDFDSSQGDYSPGYSYGYPPSNYQQPLPDITELPSPGPLPTAFEPINKPLGEGNLPLPGPPPPVPVGVSPPVYGYYYIGRKAWYIPLYFCVYFVVYVGCLILKDLYRHKAHYPEKLHEAVVDNSRKSSDSIYLLTESVFSAFEKFNSL